MSARSAARPAALPASLVLALALGAEAHAQPSSLGQVDTQTRDYQSPQRFAFEFKVGPYSPQIDRTEGLIKEGDPPASATPFADLFNPMTTPPGTQPKSQPLFLLELDWQFWRPFGSFGLAGTVGYYNRRSHSFKYVDGTDASCRIGVNCVRSGDTTTLNIIPLSLELVYRFDVMAHRWKVPLVPYVKAGVAWYIWFMQKGDGSLSRAEELVPGQDPIKHEGVGAVAGWVVHPGLALLLDILDRRSARMLDSELGINHSYLFVELAWTDIRGLSGLFKDKINLSDVTWNAGIAFEF